MRQYNGNFAAPSGMYTLATWGSFNNRQKNKINKQKKSKYIQNSLVNNIKVDCSP